MVETTNVVLEIPPWLSVFLLSILPVIELKGTIPIGVASGLPLWETFTLAYLGSSLPSVFVILLIRPALQWMKSTRILRGYANWLERRSIKKSKKLERYSLLGLFIFVAIPLPSTGVWMGSIIAALMDIPLKKAVPIICFGNLIAGGLMLTISYGLFG